MLNFKGTFKRLFLLTTITFIFLCSTTVYATEIAFGLYSPTVSPENVIDSWQPSGNLGLKTFIANDPQNQFLDALLVNTTNDISDFLYFLKYNNASNATDRIEVVASVRLDQYVGNTSLGGCAIAVEDDIKSNALLITPNFIMLSRTGETYQLDTTNNYHVYKIVAYGSSFKVYVDGGTNPVLDGAWNQQWYPARNKISFGDHSGDASSRAAWAFVKYSVFRD